MGLFSAEACGLSRLKRIPEILKLGIEHRRVESLQQLGGEPVHCVGVFAQPREGGAQVRLELFPDLAHRHSQARAGEKIVARDRKRRRFQRHFDKPLQQAAQHRHAAFRLDIFAADISHQLRQLDVIRGIHRGPCMRRDGRRMVGILVEILMEHDNHPAGILDQVLKRFVCQRARRLEIIAHGLPGMAVRDGRLLFDGGSGGCFHGRFDGRPWKESFECAQIAARHERRELLFRLGRQRAEGDLRSASCVVRERLRHG